MEELRKDFDENEDENQKADSSTAEPF